MGCAVCPESPIKQVFWSLIWIPKWGKQSNSAAAFPIPTYDGKDFKTTGSTNIPWSNMNPHAQSFIYVYWWWRNCFCITISWLTSFVLPCRKTSCKKKEKNQGKRKNTRCPCIYIPVPTVSWSSLERVHSVYSAFLSLLLTEPIKLSHSFFHPPVHPVKSYLPATPLFYI